MTWLSWSVVEEVGLETGGGAERVAVEAPEVATHTDLQFAVGRLPGGAGHAPAVAAAVRQDDTAGFGRFEDRLTVRHLDHSAVAVRHDDAGHSQMSDVQSPPG